MCISSIVEAEKKETKHMTVERKVKSAYVKNIQKA
jgi:hypothetical protein